MKLFAAPSTPPSISLYHTVYPVKSPQKMVDAPSNVNPGLVNPWLTNSNWGGTIYKGKCHYFGNTPCGDMSQPIINMFRGINIRLYHPL